jgi:hypothetical protein
MKMEMVDFLPAVSPTIDHRAVTVLRETFLFGDSTCRKQQFPADSQIVEREVVKRGNVAFGDDQDVRRCLRMDVAKRKDIIVFVDYRWFDLTGDHLTEQAVSHAFRSFLQNSLRPLKA